MGALGIPTTRAASLVITDDVAIRDPNEDGSHLQEKCAVVLRVAPSFIRFGSFEICNQKGPSQGLEADLIPKLADFVIKNHFPHLSSF